MTTPDPSQADVLRFLADPASYPDRPAQVERRDTHAAHVFLAGGRAYKMKRAVRYPFLDYSTLELRHQACDAEVRLNRRTAPSLYLGVAAVTRESGGHLALDGSGPPVEWLVAMVRFPDEALLQRVAASGRFSPAMAIALADAVAGFHARAVPTPHEGGLAGMRDVVEGNAAAFAACALDAARVEAVNAASRAHLDRHAVLLEARRAGGFVRQCHGDLHLRNIVLLGDTPTPFDAIEFNDAFACIDVCYDLAFLLMDMIGTGLGVEANVLFNHYLMRTSDLGGLPLLPLFVAARAAVRAKTSLAAAALEAGDPARRDTLLARADEYLTLAERTAADPTPRVIAVGGPSGAGKSTLAAQIAPLLPGSPGAVVLRSDVLRKMLLHRALHERLGPEGYSEPINRRVYQALEVRTADVLARGWPVVVDATFLSAEARASVANVAARAGVPFTGVWLSAPADMMAERLRRRTGDASDANEDVLRRQLQSDSGPLDWTRLDASGDPRRLAEQVRAIG